MALRSLTVAFLIIRLLACGVGSLQATTLQPEPTGKSMGRDPSKRLLSFGGGSLFLDLHLDQRLERDLRAYLPDRGFQNRLR